jgi:hypothetical protein
MTTNGTGRKQLSMGGRPWEKLLDSSNQGVLEILENNAKWWEQAAFTCESAAAHLSSDREKELVWQLFGAVYRERAGINARLIEQSRRNGAGDTATSGESR